MSAYQGLRPWLRSLALRAKTELVFIVYQGLCPWQRVVRCPPCAAKLKLFIALPGTDVEGGGYFTARRRSSALLVRSQVNVGSGRPKWPWRAVSL